MSQVDVKPRLIEFRARASALWREVYLQQIHDPGDLMIAGEAHDEICAYLFAVIVGRIVDVDEIRTPRMGQHGYRHDGITLEVRDGAETLSGSGTLQHGVAENLSGILEDFFDWDAARRALEYLVLERAGEPVRIRFEDIASFRMEEREPASKPGFS